MLSVKLTKARMHSLEEACRLGAFRDAEELVHWFTDNAPGVVSAVLSECPRRNSDFDGQFASMFDGSWNTRPLLKGETPIPEV